MRGIASERGAAVLLSTHLLTEVEENCSRVLIINRGRVVAEGTVAEIVRKAAAPRSGRLYVAPSTPPRRRDPRGLGRGGRRNGAERPTRRLHAYVRRRAERLPAPNDALRALLESGVALRSFELEGARLSDAFLAMTEAG